MMLEFVRALFEEGEQTAFGALTCRRARAVDWLTAESEFFCINPVKDRRLNKNVQVYRNILVESDTRPVAEQRARVQQLGLPFTTAVFSGGKSVHHIISLVEPCRNRDEYKQLVRRLYQALADQDMPVDRSCKNPSRLSRVPGHRRADKGGAEQSLLTVNKRVEPEHLARWIDAHLKTEVMPGMSEAERQAIRRWRTPVSGPVNMFLMYGEICSGSRHNTMVRAAFELRDFGCSPDETMDRICKVPGLLNQEVNGRTIEESEVNQIVDYVYGMES